MGQVEKDPFCLKVLDKHWKDVPRHDDVCTATDWWLGQPRSPVDVVTGGFPCQDVSVAGKRAGLAGARTGLFFAALDFIVAVQPSFVLLENVPGLLTSNQGRDFGVVIDALVEGGYPYVEWRVLDSQHFGVPQRRRRVFVVAGAGDPRSGALLSEPEGSGGDPASGRAPGPQAAAATQDGLGGGGPDPVTDTVSTLMGGGERGYRIGAEEACGGQLVPVLGNPVDGVARTVIGGGNDKHDTSRSSYVIARTLTTSTQRLDPSVETFITDGVPRSSGLGDLEASQGCEHDG